MKLVGQKLSRDEKSLKYYRKELSLGKIYLNIKSILKRMENKSALLVYFFFKGFQVRNMLHILAQVRFVLAGRWI